MNKKILIFVIVLICLVFEVALISKIKENDGQDVVVSDETEKDNTSKEPEIKDIVVIKNTDVFGDEASVLNLNLLEDFMKKTREERESLEDETSLKIRIYTTKEKYDEKLITYTKGAMYESFSVPNLEENTTNETDKTKTDVMSIIDVAVAPELFKEYYGYYTIITNNDESTKEELDANRWYIKYNTVDGKINVIFYTTADVSEFPTICTIDLSITEYESKFDLNFYQRKDMGIKLIATKGDEYDFNIFTFGGDVNIVIEKDMVYELQDALEQKVITIDDIINQAKEDEKYGLCYAGYYSDGGSIEYYYPDYTILKFNTLNGKEDVVIGFRGQIINSFNEQYQQHGGSVQKIIDENNVENKVQNKL